MNLLIVTQKVDKSDDLLAFFHGWIEEFAKHAKIVHVICLYEGEHDLPPNVQVHSLGKEVGVSKPGYILRFLRYVWMFRGEYTHVFVHMNQEYVLLAGIFWRLFFKKVFMWRNHAKGSILTNLAVLLSSKVFCTSPHSYTARFRKTKLMPVGVNTAFFKPSAKAQKKPNSILYLGRIEPVKKVDVFVDVLRHLDQQGIEFSATIAGGSSPENVQYGSTIKSTVSEYDLDSKVVFTGAVTQERALELYHEHDLYMNLTPAGSMDKTILEALACGLKVVVANTFFDNKLPKNWVTHTPEDTRSLAEDVNMAINYSLEENPKAQKKITKIVKENKLNTLINLLVAEII